MAAPMITWGCQTGKTGTPLDYPQANAGAQSVTGTVERLMSELGLASDKSSTMD